ncbi:MAG: helix-turn-helix domain-containing protein [Lachnospiraceae bacterium]|nr:helix-turn-helix domain-containing protein [Lachnospiraceae bacterium]
MSEKKDISRKTIVNPKTADILELMGGQIRQARMRRGISVELVAERAGISRSSVWKVEKGSPSVSMGIYAKVLAAIGLQENLLLIAGDDRAGRSLRDEVLKNIGGRV